MVVSRRWFIGGLASASAGAFGGCRVFRADSGEYASGTPKLKFGVISDVHLRANAKGPGFTSSGDVSTLEHTLAWYRDQGVDAVAVVGDIADHGLVEELEAFASTWFKIFPDDRAPDGRKVERVVVYGNHDWGAGFYDRFTAAKYPGETDLSRRILSARPKEHWERIFREPWEHVFRKDVKGYAFIAGQWSKGWCKGRDETGVQGLESFFAAQKGKIDPSLPFFYFQHPHPKGTCYGGWAWGQDDGTSTEILSGYPNAVAFSGHSHYSLTDDRSIWQGAFTSLGTSSLRYTSTVYGDFAFGAENSRSPASFRNDAGKVMRVIGTGDGRQGMLVSVYDDRIVFRRREFVYDGSLGADWVMPLPAAEAKPFAFAEHAKKLAVPEFPAGAAVTVKKTRAKTRGATRKGKTVVRPEMKDALCFSFPPADAVPGARAFDYEITAVPADGGKVRVFRVMPEGFNMPFTDKRCSKKVKFAVAEDRLPPAGTFRLEVRPCNVFGRTGRPVVWTGKAGV